MSNSMNIIDGSLNVSYTDVPVEYVGNLLEGFTLSGKKLPPRKIFPPPHLPKDYKPVHTFREVDKYRGSHSMTKQDAVSRGLTLGETPVFGKFLDYILCFLKSFSDIILNSLKFEASESYF